MTPIRLAVWMCVVVASCASSTLSAAEKWQPLFDGKTLDGWRASENPQSFRVEDGCIVAAGPRAHLFYDGDVMEHDFRDFDLRVEARARPGANSGVFFHTSFQSADWPRKGYEVQINNSAAPRGGYHELKKTGSLYGVRNVYFTHARDDAWFWLEVSVRGHRIQVRLDGALLVDYVEPAAPSRGDGRAGRVLSHGTFALQCHDRESRVAFRQILVRGAAPAADGGLVVGPVESALADENFDLHEGNFPLIDFHVHLKGGLTLDEALTHSRRVGINYGIAANCGVGFPITNDRQLAEYLRTLEGQPVLRGMQAEGREWVTMFSEDSIAKFDYVFTDALTFTDDHGRRVRLWIPSEVTVEDEQRFMDMYVDRIVSVLEREPIDIFVNATFLPDVLRDDYDALWTAERMDRVIDAAVRNDVAIEINARFRVPRAPFIHRAKARGAKFALGTNNGDRDLGRLEYALRMVRECGLGYRDMFLPRPAGKKPVEVKGLRRDAASGARSERAQEGWPQWRGPGRDGVAPGVTLPDPWPEKLAIRWRIEVGAGYSGPVVEDGRVVALAREGEEEVIRCVDANTGKVLWRDSYEAPYTPESYAKKHGKGPFATPTITGERVVALGIAGTLSCYDLRRGDVIWRNRFEGYEKRHPMWGAAASPLVVGGLVVTGIGTEDDGAIAGLRLEDGSVAWKLDSSEPAYAAPVLATVADKEQVVCLGRKKLMGIDPRTGDLLWSFPYQVKYDQNAITPVVGEGLVVTSGWQEATRCIQISRAGGTFRAEPLWANDDVSFFLSSPVLRDGHLFGLAQAKKGSLVCLGLRDGRERWASPGRLGEYASIVRVGDRLLTVTTEGELLVIGARATEFRVEHREQVCEGPVWAHPAVTGDGLYVKDARRLTSFAWKNAREGR